MASGCPTSSLNDQSDNSMHTSSSVNQSQGCLDIDGLSMNQSEDCSHEERIQNPYKRKRVPSMEYLDAVDRNDTYSNYLNCTPNVEKPNCSSLDTHDLSSECTNISTAEKSAIVSDSPLERRTYATAQAFEISADAESENSKPLDLSSCHNGDKNNVTVRDELRFDPTNLHQSHEHLNDMKETSTQPPSDRLEDLSALTYNSSQSVKNSETGESSCAFSQLLDSLPGPTEILPSGLSSSRNILGTKAESDMNQSDNSINETSICTCSVLSSSSSTSSSTTLPKRPFTVSSVSSPLTTLPSLSSPQDILSSSPSSSRTPFCVTGGSSRDLPLQRSENISSESQSAVHNFENPLVNKETSLAACDNDRLKFLKSVELKNNVPISAFDLSNIPSYLMIQIFQHLSMFDLLHNASSVCKLWYHLSHDPDLWRVIDLQNQLKVNDDVLTTLTSYSDRVIYLNLTDIGTITEQCLIETVAKCKYLETLKFSRCISLITDEVLKSIGKHCHSLLHLHLEVCYKITDEGIAAVTAGCPKLISLHLSQCKNVGNDGLVSLGDHCPELQTISLDSCMKVQNEGIAALANGCSELRTVNLRASGVTDEGAYHTHKLTKLQVLDLSSCADLSVRTVHAIAQNCKQLVCLNLSLISDLDDSCVEQIAMYCYHLRKFYCVSSSITDRGLEMIGIHNKSIEHLDLGWCQQVTDYGIKFVSEKCASLRYIGLIRCDGVTADGIEELVDRYPHIKYSTFILESRKIIERAKREGFVFPDP